MSIAGVLTIPALAGELRRPFQGIRNLGMGNTGIALSFDENALFYNPAGLATVDSMIVSLPFLLEVSDDSFNMYNDIQKLGSSKTADAVALLMGKRVHFRSLAALNFLMPFGELMTFGLAGGGEAMFDIGVRNPVAVEIDFGLRVDEIYNVAFGMPVARGRWLVGAGIETVQRCDIPFKTHSIGTILANTELSTSVGSCNINTDLTRAQTFNFGFQRRFEAASVLKMIWGMTANNVGGLKFKHSDNNTNPADQNVEISTGLSFQPSWGPVRMLYAIDLRDLTMKHADDTYCQSKKGTDCIWKRLHIGTEFGLFPIDSGMSIFAVRAGFNQGYFTYGFELNPFIFVRFLNIQLAVYKTETGDTIGERPEKRRVLQINFGF